MAQALKFDRVLMSWVTLWLLTKEMKDFFSVSEYTQKQGKRAVLCCTITTHVLTLAASLFQSLFKDQPFFPSAITWHGSSAAPDCWKGLCPSQYWYNSNSIFWSQPSRSKTLKNRSEACAGLNFIRGCTETITQVKQYLLLPPGE